MTVQDRTRPAAADKGPDWSNRLSVPGLTTLAGVPEGLDALTLAEIATRLGDQDLVFIARDDVRLAAMATALAQFLPGRRLITFPAWDCLPYDRVSPNPTICAQRLDCLTRFAEAPHRAGRIVLTTVNAMLQRVPTRERLAASRLALAAGDDVDRDHLTAFLENNGYVRTGTVMEAGEYSLRGGIIDLFPAGHGAPVRLDLFGDTVESIKRFDPVTQRSRKALDSLTLVPISEVTLDDQAVARFRAGYRELFGAVTAADPLYDAVSAGQRHAGIEHWLPLFHDALDTPFAFFPEAVLLLDHLADEARAERLDAIDDYYRARVAARENRSALGAPDYKPVPPDRLYLGAAEWQRHVGARPAVQFSPYPAPSTGPGGLDLGGRQVRDFTPERKLADGQLFDAVAAAIAGHLADRRRVVICCNSRAAATRLAGLLREHGIEACQPAEDWSQAMALGAHSVPIVVLPLDHGFVTDTLALYTEQDILGDRLGRPTRKPRRAADFLRDVSALEPDDLVVHIDHGIGRYDGLVTIDAGGAPHDCVRLIYADNGRLMIPVENIDVLSRFGASEGPVALDRLGSASWQARKARLKERLRDMAESLIGTAAARALADVPRLAPPPGMYEEFAARFPYAETDDQQAAIDECLNDLGSGRAMDRLVCGDVGFGKTEVALRAAFVTAYEGKQVAVVVPTTLLCRQHYKTFTDRFAGLPLRIAQLSRLVTGKPAAAARAGLADGSVDIVIGTQALLAKSVAFRNLGLVIVDEEQHFGVAQKERLKALKTDVHVLTLTATPIPRTLQLALTGVRDLSIMATPPVDRLAVRTFVLPYDPVVVREAILRERYRGGQIFYICPRIEDLDKVAAELRKIVPEVRVVVAHGQMAARQLEDAMTAFYDGGYDLLLSTSIIESGLDIPSANTLIVHRADRFGLSQLYQLRGRVGRSKLRAYTYFTVPPNRRLKGAAEKRLRAIQTLDSLGAGFSLASHDLDIRGAGNLLGEEQSGHIREVGVELYQTLLEEAVQAARDGPDAVREERWSPQITVGTAVLIPEDYVTDLSVRMSLYRRLADLDSGEAIDAFADELVDRFGPLPTPAGHLLKIVRVKQLCRQAGIEKIEAGPKGAVIAFHDNRFANPDKLVGYIAQNAETVRLRPDHKLVFTRRWPNPETRLDEVLALTQQLADMTA